MGGDFQQLQLKFGIFDKSSSYCSAKNLKKFNYHDKISLYMMHTPNLLYLPSIQMQIYS